MEIGDAIEAVRNDRIKFVTMRPSGSQFAMLERRVVVTGPAEVVKLSESGDVRVLDELVNLLKEPDRAWAAVVVLSALTGREAKIVDTYASAPDTWWDPFGKRAYQRWSDWLTEDRDKLVWDSQEKMFVEKQ